MEWACPHCTLINQVDQQEGATSLPPHRRLVCSACSKSVDLNGVLRPASSRVRVFEHVQQRSASPPSSPTFEGESRRNAFSRLRLAELMSISENLQRNLHYHRDKRSSNKQEAAQSNSRQESTNHQPRVERHNELGAESLEVENPAGLSSPSTSRLFRLGLPEQRPQGGGFSDQDEQSSHRLWLQYRRRSYADANTMEQQLNREGFNPRFVQLDKVNSTEFPGPNKDDDKDESHRIFRFLSRSQTAYSNAIVVEATQQSVPVYQALQPVPQLRHSVATSVKERGKDATQTRECPICMDEKQLLRIPLCNCRVCSDCLCQYIDTSLRNQTSAAQLNCPVCNKPDPEGLANPSCDYFPQLRVLLKMGLTRETLQLFDDRLRDSLLDREKNKGFFRCSGCESGFYVSEHHDRQVRCRHCGKETCRMCGQPWQEQHRGKSCEQFAVWRRQTDAGQRGLDKFLESRCIHCPKCGLQFELSKGGCLHMKCRECQAEFCSDCGKLFVRGDCCPSKGFHCHHGDECIEVYRDWPIDKVRRAAAERGVRLEAKACGKAGGQCGVQEQKETADGKKLFDAECGRPVLDQGSGLCETHLKEALVSAMRKPRQAQASRNSSVPSPVSRPQTRLKLPKLSLFNDRLRSEPMSESPSREAVMSTNLRSSPSLVRTLRCEHCTTVSQEAPLTSRGARWICTVCGKTNAREEFPLVADNSDDDLYS